MLVIELGRLKFEQILSFQTTTKNYSKWFHRNFRKNSKIVKIIEKLERSRIKWKLTLWLFSTHLNYTNVSSFNCWNIKELPSLFDVISGKTVRLWRPFHFQLLCGGCISTTHRIKNYISTVNEPKKKSCHKSLFRLDYDVTHIYKFRLYQH